MSTKDEQERLRPTPEVARLAGVSARTLRHYDQVGLVRPRQVGAGGLRWYGETELRRLHRVLLLRRLGLGLAEVAEALDGGDEPAVLRRHLARLRAEADRLEALAAAVERTLDDQEGRRAMRAEELFEGFDAGRQPTYEAELAERFGDEVRAVIDASWRRIEAMSPADASDVQEAFARHEHDLAALMDAGAPVDDPRVQEVVAAHHATVSRFWTPDADAYVGLGELYVDSPDFRARYEAVRPGLAEYLRDAMAVHAVEVPAG